MYLKVLFRFLLFSSAISCYYRANKLISQTILSVHYFLRFPVFYCLFKMFSVSSECSASTTVRETFSAITVCAVSSFRSAFPIFFVAASSSWIRSSSESSYSSLMISSGISSRLSSSISSSIPATLLNPSGLSGTLS